MIDLPGIPGENGVQEWLIEAVPGLIAALERVNYTLVVGPHAESLREAVASQFDTDSRSLKTPKPKAARRVLQDLFDAETVALELLYSDVANALVSELYDDATVHEVTYEQTVRIRLKVSHSAVAALRGRVSELDGQLRTVEST